MEDLSEGSELEELEDLSSGSASPVPSLADDGAVTPVAAPPLPSGESPGLSSGAATPIAALMRGGSPSPHPRPIRASEVSDGARSSGSPACSDESFPSGIVSPCSPFAGAPSPSQRLAIDELSGDSAEPLNRPLKRRRLYADLPVGSKHRPARQLMRRPCCKG